jgi:hypothetical protein
MFPACDQHQGRHIVGLNARARSPVVEEVLGGIKDQAPGPSVRVAVRLRDRATSAIHGAGWRLRFAIN